MVLNKLKNALLFCRRSPNSFTFYLFKKQKHKKDRRGKKGSLSHSFSIQEHGTGMILLLRKLNLLNVNFNNNLKLKIIYNNFSGTKIKTFLV